MDTDPPPGIEAIASWRAHALDGALLYFDPATGRSVRIDAPFTRSLRRQAPRVVLFALSHACNLRCGFCARERTTQRWSNDAAFELLAGLAQAGSLEVAFGGGEPLLHRGFEALVARLAEETALAVHLTTNGTRLDARTARALAPHVGQVRVSIYDDNPWRDALMHLGDQGVMSGANVIVDPDRLPQVHGLLATLAELGVADVALLRRVDADGRGQLDELGFASLEAILRDAPLPVRVSHCFADRMPGLPRLFAGIDGDACGAGRDFVVIDPSEGPGGTYRACSFHDAKVSFADAADLLARWRAAPAALAAPAARVGCARPFTAEMPEDGVRVYRAFASNNSGDTVLVARFVSAAKAAALSERLAELETGDRDAKWRDALDQLGAHDMQQPFPVIARAVGECLFASAVDADDALGGVRLLVAAEHGLPVLSAIHLHDSTRVVVGLGGEHDAARRALGRLGARASERHGDATFAVVTPGPRNEWEEVIDAVRAVAEGLGAPLAAELTVPARKGDGETLGKVLSQPEPDGPGYLMLNAPRGTPLARVASEFGGPSRVAYAAGTILVRLARPPRRRQLFRLAKRGFVPCLLPMSASYEVTFSAWSSGRRKAGIRDRVAAAFQTVGGPSDPFRLQESHGAVYGAMRSADPLAPLDLIRRVDLALHPSSLRFSAFVRDTQPLRAAVGRVRRELRVLTGR